MFISDIGAHHYGVSLFGVDEHMWGWACPSAGTCAADSSPLWNDPECILGTTYRHFRVTCLASLPIDVACGQRPFSEQFAQKGLSISERAALVAVLVCSLGLGEDVP